MLLCRAGYLGWNYRGTNVQPEGRTVEGEMEKILGGKVRFLSRTDAGVSALNNYALCWPKTNPFSVNRLEDVWIVGYREIRRRPKVFWRWYRYYLPGEVEISKDLLELFLGRKDFSSFSAPESGRPTVREILRFSSFVIPGFTVFDVVGKSFSRQMVRRMVTGAVLAERDEIDIEELFKRPRPGFVPPSPPDGLVLMNMKLDVYVPAREDVVKGVKKRLSELWSLFRLRSKILSERWIVGLDF